MSTRKTTAERIEAAKIEKQQMEARIKELLQRQREEERKARTHRFCRRGGLMEKLLPDLARLTDEQFEAFFKSTTANHYGRKALAELVPPTPETAAEPTGETVTAKDGDTSAAAPAQAAARTEPNPATQSTTTAAQDTAAPTPKPTQATQNANGNNHSKTTEASRVAG